MKENKNADLNCIRICVVSNMGINPIFVSALNEVLLENRIRAQISFVSSEEIYEINNVDIIKKSDYVINWFDIYNDSCILNSDFIDDALVDYFDSYCLGILYYIRSITQSRIFCLSLTDFSCRDDIYLGSLLNKTVIRCNFSLAEKQDTLALNIINLEKIISKCGHKEAYSYKDYIRWNSKYSSKLYKSVAYEFYKSLLADKGITKKCIVVDCDNVLWGGILSDDGIEGIQLSNNGIGKTFWDFQRFLLDLYYHGVILTVCSKNDEPEVLKVFREHTGMILKENNIAYFCCNWENKSDNILAISEFLNIGLESIVFVDDSLFEIESVRYILPKVTTVLFQKDNIYENLSCFNLRKNIDLKTISERINTYKTNTMRNQLRDVSLSYEEYISSLKMVIDFHETIPSELARIAELTQRTNKCTNGVRYSQEQMMTLLHRDKYNLYTVCLSDRFSDLGIIGTIGICENHVDLFSLSCRALGRNIEEQLIDRLRKRNVASFRFISTGKNESFKQLLLTSGLVENNNWDV